MLSTNTIFLPILIERITVRPSSKATRGPIKILEIIVLIQWRNRIGSFLTISVTNFTYLNRIEVIL